VRGEDAGDKPPEPSEVDAALSLFDRILEKRPDYDCNALNMYTRRRLFKLMVENLDEARLRKDGLQLLEAFQTHDIMPTNLAQNRVICAWRSKLPEHVLQYFAEMRRGGVMLSATAYRCIMAANERTDPETTLQLYDEMVSRGLKLDRVAFNAALCAYSHLGKTHQALQLFEAMPGHSLEPNGKTYGTLIRACTTANKVYEALELFQTMQEKGFAPNRYAYHDVIHCCVKSRRLGKAVTLYREMVNAHVPPCDSTFLHLSKACRKNGWTKIADEIMEGLSSNKKPETPRDESEASTEFRDAAGVEEESD
jgi:pentatricopeptide repeat protein